MDNQLAVQNYNSIGHTPVSYSSLKKLRAGGILEFYRYKERELEQEYSDSLTLGTLIDIYLLNQEEFKEKYVVNDVESPSSPNQQKFCQLLAHSAYSIEDAYRESYSCKNKSEKKVAEESIALHKELAPYIKFIRDTVGKEYYSKDDSYALNQIRMNISGHKVARDLFPWITMQDNSKQFEILYHVDLTGEFEGFPIKGEVDLVVIDHVHMKVYVYDLKSTKAYIQNFKYEARNYGYFLQLYLYTLLVKQNLVPEGYTLEMPRFLIVRNQGSFNVGIRKVSKEQMMLEKTALEEDFKLLSWHYEHKKFKYPKEYYQGDGVLELEVIKNQDLWQQEIEDQLSEKDSVKDGLLF